MDYRYAASVSSDSLSICKLVSQIIQDPILQSLLCPDQLLDLRLVLSELMINASEHGNRNCPDKKVFVNLAIDDDQIRVRVRDEGEGLCPGSLVKAGPNQCSGRGLTIVKALCDSIRVDKSAIVCSMKRVVL